MSDLNDTLRFWFWNFRFQTQIVLSVLRYQLVTLIGQHRGTLLTALALLAFVVAAFMIVFVIAWFVGTVAGQTKGPGYCRHGRPVGNRTKNFCAECAMEKGAAEEIHARLRAQRARRAQGEEF